MCRNIIWIFKPEQDPVVVLADQIIVILLFRFSSNTVTVNRREREQNLREGKE